MTKVRNIQIILMFSIGIYNSGSSACSNVEPVMDRYEILRNRVSEDPRLKDIIDAFDAIDAQGSKTSEEQRLEKHDILKKCHLSCCEIQEAMKALIELRHEIGVKQRDVEGLDMLKFKIYDAINSIRETDQALSMYRLLGRSTETLVQMDMKEWKKMEEEKREACVRCKVKYEAARDKLEEAEADSAATKAETDETKAQYEEVESKLNEAEAQNKEAEAKFAEVDPKAVSRRLVLANEYKEAANKYLAAANECKEAANKYLAAANKYKEAAIKDRDAQGERDQTMVEYVQTINAYIRILCSRSKSLEECADASKTPEAEKREVLMRCRVKHEELTIKCKDVEARLEAAKADLTKRNSELDEASVKLKEAKGQESGRICKAAVEVSELAGQVIAISSIYSALADQYKEIQDEKEQIMHEYGKVINDYQKAAAL